MLKIHNPASIAPPASIYSHAIEVPAGARWLYLAGQVGAKPDGVMAEGFKAQCKQTWENLIVVLNAAGMDIPDLVRVNGYITDKADVAAFREVRIPYLGETRTSFTLVVVADLASPDWLVEIDAVAAKV
ncbi:MAG TPA: RidA family protein [Alphaproteobacteria bacterium]|nr:RidA family protein [Alphaproteobacteria bacterium]